MATYRNLGLFLVLAVVWGVAYTAIKVGLEFFPPVTYAAIRYDVAAVCMLAYVSYVTEYWRPKDAKDLTVTLIGGVLVIGAYNAFLFVGEQFVSSAVAAIIIGLNPVLTTGFSRVLLPDERLTPVGVFGLLLSLGGVVVIAQPDPANVLSDGVIGQGLVLVAALSIALGSVLIRRIEHGIQTEGMVAWSTLWGALLLHVVGFGLPSESLSQIEWTTTAVFSLLYLAILASAFGYFLYFILLDRLGPIEINLVSYAAAGFAAISGWFLLNETLSMASVIGFVAIFSGFVIVKRRAIREKLATRQPIRTLHE